MGLSPGTRRRVRQRSVVLVALLIVTAFLLSACAESELGDEAPPSDSVTAETSPESEGDEPQELVEASLNLGWIASASGYMAPFFLALEEGFYADEGIDLTLRDGEGSSGTVTLVGAGQETFGLANSAVVAVAIANEGVPVTSIAGILQRMPESVIALEGSGISSPTDVEGMIWGHVPGSSGELLFPALAEQTGIDTESITTRNLEARARLSTLLAGDVDFVTGWELTEVPLLESMGATSVVAIPYREHGVNVLGSGLITSLDTIESQPELVRGFVSASIRGIEEAMADPEAAIDALIEHRPDAEEQRELLLAQLGGLFPLLQTDRSADQALGWQAVEDWEESAAVLEEHMDLEPSYDIEAIFTNDLIPDQ